MGSGWLANTVVLVFTLVAGLVVFLRLVTRGFMLRVAGFEDVYSTFAMVASIGLTVTIGLQIQNGMGQHIADLTKEQMINSQKAFWASLWIYNLALTSTKLSILVQYLRIFPNVRFRLVCFVAIGVVIAWGVWSIFGNMFICLPVTFFWNKDVLGGKCLNQTLVWFMNASINIAQDVIILLMPIWVLRGLAIPAKQKKALIIVFLLGGVVCIISIVRLKYLVAIANSPDPTFDNLHAALLSAIEVNVGIICACLPSMRPLLAAMMPAYFPDTSGYSNARRTYDEERVKDLQNYSMSSVSYPARTANRGHHSRHGSNSQTFTPRHGSKSSHHPRTGSGASSRTHSRNGSRTESIKIYRQPSKINTITRTASQLRTHTRTHSNSSNRGPTRNGPIQLETYFNRPSDTTQPRTSNQSHARSHSRSNSSSSSTYSRSQSHSRNGSQSELYISQAMLTNPSHGIHGPLHRPSTSTAFVHQQHNLHPLRLSPYNPATPKLPQLPENMATFDPFQRPLRGALGPPHTPSRLVFHKPLPITPYPIPMGSAPAVAAAKCAQCATGICTLHLVVQGSRPS
ncbi:hypothetical protein CC80DRAFT_99403 [Byssothecium circinans]|uniref:Rhodopsin domain-containing protein n=1 Tax=Byssothecium circinans TaxID=147558 RepID=A0A6A5UFZ0_9PLEO|nr:hypothetical protein CC80DRAFT_99403 [Byssothecium circinans]